MSNQFPTKGAKFTGHAYGTTISVDFDSNDVGVDECLSAFISILRGLTWQDSTIKQYIIELADEYKEEDIRKQERSDKEDYQVRY
jgi:hypothetical protein